MKYELGMNIDGNVWYNLDESQEEVKTQVNGFDSRKWEHEESQEEE